MTTLDIFIPYYGGIDLLKKAVDSVIRQSNPNWRLIIVDDAFPSNDASIYLATIFDKRVTYIRNEINLGIGKNFQKCFELANAKFVTLMGSDDELQENYVSRILNLSTKFSSAAYIQPNVEVIDLNDDQSKPLSDIVKGMIRPKVKSSTILSGDKLLATLMIGNWTYFPSIAWNLDWIKKVELQTKLSITLDLDLQARLIFLGGGMVLDPGKPIFKYRRHATSESMKSSSALERFNQERELMEWVSLESKKLGYSKSPLAARFRITSRFNSMLLSIRMATLGDFPLAKKLIKLTIS